MSDVPASIPSTTGPGGHPAPDEAPPAAGPGPTSADPPARDPVTRLTATVFGLVQGVGFRDYVRTRGRRLGLVGSATNRLDGGVDVVAEGPEPACLSLLELLVTGHTPGRTDRVEHALGPPRGGLAGFVRR